MNINKRIAEILVESGYRSADHVANLKADGYWLSLNGLLMCHVEALSDTLEGRRQAHAIVNHLIKQHFDIWAMSAELDKDMNDFDIFEFTGRRIKWCISQLEKDDGR